MRRGEIWVANLNPNRGNEVGKIRPVLILQADFLIGQGEPTLVVLPLTTQVRKSKEPLHVTIPARGPFVSAYFDVERAVIATGDRVVWLR